MQPTTRIGELDVRGSSIAVPLFGVSTLLLCLSLYLGALGVSGSRGVILPLLFVLGFLGQLTALVLGSLLEAQTMTVGTGLALIAVIGVLVSGAAPTPETVAGLRDVVRGLAVTMLVTSVGYFGQAAVLEPNAGT